VGEDPWAIGVAAIVLLVLTLVMRWVFRPSRPRAAVRPPDATDSPDLGLLTVILSGLDRQEAMIRRATLGESGVRSSMSRRRDGRYDVLVFHGDANKARILLGP
jgi:hypothetical protein